MTMENNLIGYDPLAWMDEETKPDTDDAQIVKQTVELVKPPIIAQEQIQEETTKTLQADEEHIIQVLEESLVENHLDSLESNETTENENVIEEHQDDLLLEPSSNDLDNTQFEVETMSDDVNEVTEETSISEIKGEPLIDLEAKSSIQTVGNLYEQLKCSLASHDKIEIDASAVSSIDTATLQLLVSLKKDASHLQKEVSIIYPSSKFIESAYLLGVYHLLC